MRALEAAAEAVGHSAHALMEEAGLAAAQETWLAMNGSEQRAVLVLVGPGNNGGDGLVAARHLLERGMDVHVSLLRPRAADDPVWQAALEAGVPVTLGTGDPDGALLGRQLEAAECVLDALLGTGANRPIAGDMAVALGRLREARARTRPPYLIALDLPTGVHADTGAADPLTVAADQTVCFGYLKTGMTQQPAGTLCGEIVCVDIGIPPALAEALPYEEADLVAARGAAVPRSPASHKGTFGHAMVAGGSRRYPGAVRLAAEACARAGTGLTTIAAPAVVQPLIAPGFPDATHEPLPSAAGMVRGAEAARTLLRALPGVDALLLGPGLGHTPASVEFIAHVLAGLDAVESMRAVVLDADALNALATLPGWWAHLALPRVLTTHPAEMGRLLRWTVAQVQADRLATALHAAVTTDSVVVLKGAGTIIAAPDGRARLSSAANPMLATAGTGDVLAGLITGLIAQGADPFDAASAAVYVHAEAGAIVARELGAASGLAQDLLRALAPPRRAMDRG